MSYTKEEIEEFKYTQSRKSFQGTPCFAQERIAYDTGFREGFEKSQSLKDEDKWVSVKDKPKSKGEYNVVVEFSENHIKVTTDFFDGYQWTKFGDNVIQYQPIPPAPQV